MVAVWRYYGVPDSVGVGWGNLTAGLGFDARIRGDTLEGAGSAGTDLIGEAEGPLHHVKGHRVACSAVLSG